MRSISLTLLVWVLSFPALSMAAGPADQVRNTIDKVLEMVRTPSLKSPDQKKDFRSQLAELISPRFDFAEMAKRALGPQWARRSPDEQREFVKLFADLLGRSYADRIAAYSNQSVAYTREVEDKDYAEVDTTVVSEKQEKVSINYKLHVLDKEWRVYDLVIEDVSVVNNYRSQFNRIIARSSFAELMRTLKAKQS